MKAYVPAFRQYPSDRRMPLLAAVVSVDAALVRNGFGSMLMMPVSPSDSLLQGCAVPVEA